jgi:aryl-alcohol dehydrogenase-like predicted oxidoreductase
VLTGLLNSNCLDERRTMNGKKSHASAGATAAATQRFADRSRSAFQADFYRSTRSGLTLSSLALGTYLGESDDATDDLYRLAIGRALASGINTIDCAINYRCQRSERATGRALREAIAEGAITRDAVVVCTKAGYVPLDGNPPASRDEYQAYLKREYFDPGVLNPGDLVSGGHAMTPAFLRDQAQRSLRNLGVGRIDYFYLHNPEHQLGVMTREEFAKRARAAFETLEELVGEGVIASYGCATWNGLRLPAGSAGHLSLYELAAAAKEVAGEKNHFSIVQLPINLSMSEAMRVSTQRDPKGRLVNVTAAAAELGIDLVASAPLMQGQLTQELPRQVRELFPGTTDAQKALAFVRSVPGVVTAAVGMKSVDHVDENLGGLKA